MTGSLNSSVSQAIVAEMSEPLHAKWPASPKRPRWLWPAEVKNLQVDVSQDSERLDVGGGFHPFHDDPFEHRVAHRHNGSNDMDHSSRRSATLSLQRLYGALKH